jgi:Tfp pilus assembly protein FimT
MRSGPAGTNPRSSSRRPARGGRVAFTLLEVMIVIGMAALVMTISIPFVQRTIRRDAVYQAVHTVEEACRNARSLAIFNNATTELIIRPHEKDFSVRPGQAVRSIARPSIDPETGEERPVSVGFGKQAAKPFHGTLGEDVVIEMLDVNFVEHRDDEEARVRFHPNGTTDEFTIVLRIGATAWRKITLDIVTGLPTLEVIR